MSERVSKDLLLNLYAKFEVLVDGLDPSKMEYFDYVDEIQRNMGRLVLLISEYDKMQDESLDEWFDIATESYEQIVFTQSANELDPLD